MDVSEILRRQFVESLKGDLRAVPELGNSLSYQDLLYMELIYLTPGCTASYLADTLGIARSAVTTRLNRLESAGAVVRTRSETDGRVQILTVSGDIESYLREFYGLLDDVEGVLSERYTKDQIALFGEMTDFLTDYYLKNSEK